MDYFFRIGPDGPRDDDADGRDETDGREDADGRRDEAGRKEEDDLAETEEENLDKDDDGENDWREERGESERDSGENLKAWEGEYDSRVGLEDIRGESNLEKSRLGEILRSGDTDERLVSLDG